MLHEKKEIVDLKKNPGPNLMGCMDSNLNFPLYILIIFNLPEYYACIL